ncbi:MAG: Z-ring formation inhibitor MciZ [Peptococcaceae bacterium]|nr:MAG: Z-ring formation inhibitor MciZ [Peptococcaceae bacterium]
MQIFISSDRIYFCGKINEIRYLLLKYISQYRTVKELINSFKMN